MNEIQKYCKHCGEIHIVSPTYDGDHNVVGYFCNREKLLCEAVDSTWNGTDIMEQLRPFIVDRVDFKALYRMERSRIKFLAKRIAFQLLQTEWARSERLNFAFVQYWMTVEITGIYDRLQAAGM